MLEYLLLGQNGSIMFSVFRFSVFQVKISFFSVLAVLFLQHCLLGQGAAPQDYGDEYRKMVDEYKDIAKKHTGILNATIANDPAFRRAKNWLEHEQLEINSPAMQEDREFFATLKEDDDKRRYRDWQQGVTAKVSLDVFENEWNKYPASHKALLLWAVAAVKMIERQRLSKVESETAVSTDQTESRKALLLWADDVMKQIAPKTQHSKGGGSNLGSVRGLEDDSQWQRFVDDAKDASAELVEQIPSLAQSLGVKPEVVRHFEEMVANTTLFNVYDTYYRLYYPAELKNLERQQRLGNQLTEINPNWWDDEGIESSGPLALIAPVVRSPLSWILMGLGAILIVYALVRVIYQQRNKR